jgi:hypothetical protein
VDLHQRINELTRQQFIALRFASDDEIRRWSRGSVWQSATPKAIKERVKNWQGDYLRC